MKREFLSGFLASGNEFTKERYRKSRTGCLVFSFFSSGCVLLYRFLCRETLLNRGSNTSNYQAGR